MVPTTSATKPVSACAAGKRSALTRRMPYRPTFNVAPASTGANARGRPNVSPLQPGVDRNQASLHAESKEREEKHSPAGGRTQSGGTGLDRFELQGARPQREQQESERGRQRSGFAHRKQQVPRADLAVVTLPAAHHEQVAQDGHDFPRQQEQQGVAGDHDQNDRRIKR